MKNVMPNKEYIAACGLYCAACPKFISEKCQGCRQNEKATWCKIRKCVHKNGFSSCADCKTTVTDCRIYSNFIGKIFAFIFKSDRAACIHYIQKHGEQSFAEEMARRKCHTIKKTKQHTIKL